MKKEIKERIIERHSWRTDTKGPETDETNKEHNAEIKFAVEETAKEIFEKIDKLEISQFTQFEDIADNIELLKKQFLEEDKK